MTKTTINAEHQQADTKTAVANKYNIDVPAQLQLAPGETKSLNIVIDAAEGFEIKMETPFAADFQTQAAHLSIAAPHLGKEAITINDKKRLQLNNTITAEAVGEGSVETKLSFFVCNADLCERFVETKTTLVQVSDAHP